MSLRVSRILLVVYMWGLIIVIPLLSLDRSFDAELRNFGVLAAWHVVCGAVSLVLIRATAPTQPETQPEPPETPAAIAVLRRIEAPHAANPLLIEPQRKGLRHV